MSQEEDTARLVHDVLGADVVGIYRHGSAVLDGLRPHSDLDLLVVSRQRMTWQQRRALVDGLLWRSGAVGRSGSARPVELTVAVESELKPWRYPPRCEFQYGEWLRAEFESGELPAPVTSPDLAPLVTMVLLGDAAVYGPSPGLVLDPVPHEDLVHAFAAAVPELLDELWSDTRNVVLTLARIWSTLVTGVISSKDVAADWALRRLPEEHRPVLEHARAVYLAQQEQNWDDTTGRVRSCAEYLVEAIRELLAHDGYESPAVSTPSPPPSG
ncbi:aminoglycoside adenylyltransferase family protein [Actinopolyspora saharensis]|uniref:Streptomycin 3-adenylyltransferase n=1 Tax=Actinopolyspora saharensis TaxID=995062 RepID=A0A1H0ZRT7_9ACTN|nr:aminoglycoside adenylyltransferase family protein [Actinopolyspora saharensis]SDQ30215.1 streptomycin 3-adenylyltransferase [Actinopolyspora saharensis]